MSEEEKSAPVPGEELQPELDRGTLERKGLRFALWVVLGFALVIAGLAWYASSKTFKDKLRGKVVAVLEQTTGGRVELAQLHFSLWHLALEADGLVIHGLEGPGEAPYLQAEKIEVRLTIRTFLTASTRQRLTGQGWKSRIGLNLLRVTRPQVHLIVYPDGSTNQPEPKQRSSNRPVMDMLLDLEAEQVEVDNGLALINDRAIPFDIAAHDLGLQLHYVAASDQYSAILGISDLRSRMMQAPDVQSRLQTEFALGRNLVVVKSLTYTTGKTSKLEALGELDDFAHPKWKASVHGSLELRQITLLTAVNGLTAGTVDLDLEGRSCSFGQPVAEKPKYFWQGGKSKKTEKPQATADCSEAYLITGNAKLHRGGYEDYNVRTHDLDGAATVHITPSLLLLPYMEGDFYGGGTAIGSLKIENWISDVEASEVAPAKTTRQVRAAKTVKGGKLAAPVPAIKQRVGTHALIAVELTQLPLRTVMDVTAPRDFGDLGFDTAVTGPATVEWGDTSDSVVVTANMTMAPTGVKRSGARADLPVTGSLMANYHQDRQHVSIESLHAQTPQTTVDASGIIAILNGGRDTDLQVDMGTGDLGEFDSLLRALEYQGNGRSGAAGLPVVLHGRAQFHGTASGQLADLDVKGHVEAQQFEAVFPGNNSQPTPATNGPANGKTSVLPELRLVQFDSAIAEMEYKPSAIFVASSTIKRGTAVINLSGRFTPYRDVGRRGVVSYAWDKRTVVDAKVDLDKSKVEDLLPIAGLNAPITGTVQMHAHASGQLNNLNGGGEATLMKGTAYGEPYQSAMVNFNVQGSQIGISQGTVVFHLGAQIALNGSYDIVSHRVRGHVQTTPLKLSQFHTTQTNRLHVDAIVSFTADADGTLEEPGLKASLQVGSLSMSGEPMGEMNAEMHSEGPTLYFSSHSQLINGRLEAGGQTQLTGNYQTLARMEFSSLDVNSLLRLYAPKGITGHSAIGGSVMLVGPLKQPRSLNGEVELNEFDAKLVGIELKEAEPVRFNLHNGLLRIEQAHITGMDTDLKAMGTAQLFGVTNPKGGDLKMHAEGTISMALAESFDPDIISSGRVKLLMDADGTVQHPELHGSVQFSNVNVALEDVPNGLSQMNGTLVFNQDRLEVDQLTAMTGGGQIKLGGFFTYHEGLYADMTATGNNVRVRLYGLSATANSNLRFQGGSGSALISGDILVTRFGVGQEFDFAGFANTGSVSAPTDPDALSSRIRMDVHVTSSPQLDFQNSYAKLAGTVALNLRGSLAEPSLLGQITVTEGSATFAGTQYQLQRGQVYFTNPVRIDPVIDLDATARVENYDITIGLHGTSNNLKPTYRSEPPLSEADIFALLALGRTQEEASIYNQQQEQAGTDPATNALLGGALNATVSSRVQKLFGVGSVKIDPSFVGALGTSTARITVEQQISRQLTLRYAANVNETAEQLVQAEWALTNDMSVVTTRDESGVFSVVFKIRRRYK